jgi:integrase/recombinase XerD
MEKFIEFLKANGISWHTAIQYSRIASGYVKWVKESGHTVASVKRTQFTDWLEQLRKEGQKETTIRAKEGIVKQYYVFMGYRNNPAVSFLKYKRTHTLPPTAIDMKELEKIYQSLKPKSPADYRNRCLLGLVLYQGMTRSELAALRLQHIDFDRGTVHIEASHKKASRILPLQGQQAMHLLDYTTRYRHGFLAYKTDQQTDKVFLSKGSSDRIENSLTRMLYFLKRDHKYIVNLLHLRGSLITHWGKTEGPMEAMVKSGMKWVTSVERYQSNEYDELEKLLKDKHPLQSIITTTSR